MCLISSFHSTVFTQWFNTSTRLGPPLKIFTQECDMVQRYIWEHHDGERDEAGAGRRSIVTLT
jgi:hypothetical protein